MIIWQRRILRFWALVLLPLGLYFGYEAYDSHVSISFWQSSVDKWHESLRLQDQGKYQGIFDPREQFNEALKGRDINIENRRTFSILSSVLFCFPVITWLVFRAVKWVWHGNRL